MPEQNALESEKSVILGSRILFACKTKIDVFENNVSNRATQKGPVGCGKNKQKTFILAHYIPNLKPRYLSLKKLQLEMQHKEKQITLTIFCSLFKISKEEKMSKSCVLCKPFISPK